MQIKQELFMRIVKIITFIIRTDAVLSLKLRFFFFSWYFSNFLTMFSQKITKSQLEEIILETVWSAIHVSGS